MDEMIPYMPFPYNITTCGTCRFNFNNIGLSEKTVIGSLGYVHEFPTVIGLISGGRIDPSGLITAKVALKDAVEKAFKELISNPDKHIKILLHP